MRIALDASANLSKEAGERKLLISQLNANANASRMEWNKQSFGDAALQAETRGSTLSFRLDSNFAQAAIHGSGEAQLQLPDD